MYNHLLLTVILSYMDYSYTNTNLLSYMHNHLICFFLLLFLYSYTGTLSPTLLLVSHIEHHALTHIPVNITISYRTTLFIEHFTATTALTKVLYTKMLYNNTSKRKENWSNYNNKIKNYVMLLHKHYSTLLHASS